MTRKNQHTPDIESVEIADGRYLVHNRATGTSATMTRMQLADYIRRHAQSPEHVPIGDYLHEGLKRIGFTGCLPCAERQAALNRLVHWRRRR